MGVNSDRTMVASEPKVCAAEERRCLCIIRDMSNVDEPRREVMNVPASTLCSQFFSDAVRRLDKNPEQVTLIYEVMDQQIEIEGVDEGLTLGNICQADDPGKKYTFHLYPNNQYSLSQEETGSDIGTGTGPLSEVDNCNIKLRERGGTMAGPLNEVIESKSGSDTEGMSASGTGSGIVGGSSYSSYAQAVSRTFDTGYVGLVNQAMTCYLNSLLQTLYMTPEFRNAVYRWEYDGTEEEAVKSIPFQLQRLFLQLQTSKKRAVETTDITKSFGWDSSEAWQQHDVQELCRVMFDALERKLKNTDQADLINQLYQGQLKDYVKCLACGYESARVDTYLDIPLVVRPFGATHSYGSVEEALTAFVEPEILNGTNQYFCEQCNAKCDAHKGLKFKTFPYMLMLQLKRFDFDYNNMQRIKLNDRVTFPELLDLSFLMADDDDVKCESDQAMHHHASSTAAEQNSNSCCASSSAAACRSCDIEALAAVHSDYKACSNCNKSAAAEAASSCAGKSAVVDTVANSCSSKKAAADSCAGNSAAAVDQAVCSSNAAENTCACSSTSLKVISSNHVSSTTKSDDDGVDEGIDIEDNASSGQSTLNNNSCDHTNLIESVSESDLISLQSATTASTAVDDKATVGDATSTAISKPGCQYELLSIMVHSGGAGGGHYYAYIRSFKDGEWYSFNDQNVTMIAQSDIEKTYGTSPSSSYSYYSPYSSSSANAYMLIYRRKDEVKNKKFIEPDDFPPHIVEHLRRLKQKEEEENHQREIERNTCKIRLFYYETSMEKYMETKLEVHKDLTLAQATEVARKQLYLTNKPLDCVRLVKYDNVTDYIDRSYSNEEMSQPIYEVLGGVRTIYSFDLLMEVKEKDQEFIEYTPGGITVKLHVVIRDGDVGPAIPLRIAPNQTIGQFKKCVAQLLKAGQDKADSGGSPLEDENESGETCADNQYLICVTEKSFRQLHPLVNDDLNLSFESIGKGSKVYAALTSDIKDVEASAKSFRETWLYNQLDQYQNTVHIDIILPSLDKISKYVMTYLNVTEQEQDDPDDIDQTDGTSSHTHADNFIGSASRDQQRRNSLKGADYEDEGIGESETTSDHTEDSTSHASWTPNKSELIGDEKNKNRSDSDHALSTGLLRLNDISVSIDGNQRRVRVREDLIGSRDVELQPMGASGSGVAQLDDFDAFLTPDPAESKALINPDHSELPAVESSDCKDLVDVKVTGCDSAAGLLVVGGRGDYGTIDRDKKLNVPGSLSVAIDDLCNSPAASFADPAPDSASRIVTAWNTMEAKEARPFVSKTSAGFYTDIAVPPSYDEAFLESSATRFDYDDTQHLHEGLSQGSGSSQTVEVGDDIGDITTESLTDIAADSPLDDEGVMSLDAAGSSVSLSPIPPAPPLYVDSRGLPVNMDNETGECAYRGFVSRDNAVTKTITSISGQISDNLEGVGSANVDLREDVRGGSQCVDESWDIPPEEEKEEPVERYFKADYKQSAREPTKYSEQTLRVHIDRRITLQQLKTKLEPFIGVPAQHFKVFRFDRLSTTDRTEETKLTDSLYNFNDDTKVELKLGRSLRAGEFKVVIYQLRLNEQQEPIRLMSDVEPVLVQGMTVRRAKRVILKELQLHCFMQIPIDRLRLRLKSFSNPNKILTDEKRIGVDDLTHIRELLFEILDEDDPIKPGRSNEVVQIYLRRWSPSKYSVGQLEEVVVENREVETLIDKISDVSGIDKSNVSFAKVRQNFPGDVSVLEVGKMEWDPSVSRINQWPVSVLDDGDVIFYKDRTEEERELDDEEKEKLTKQENTRFNKPTIPFTSRFTPHKERALKIYTDDTPSKYPSNSSKSISPPS